MSARLPTNSVLHGGLSLVLDTGAYTPVGALVKNTQQEQYPHHYAQVTVVCLMSLHQRQCETTATHRGKKGMWMK